MASLAAALSFARGRRHFRLPAVLHVAAVLGLGAAVGLLAFLVGSIVMIELWGRLEWVLLVLGDGLGAR